VNCQDAQGLLHAYADGELDLVRHLEMERHLGECPGCAGAYERQQALRAALRAEGLRFEAPAALRQRVRSSLRQAGPGPSGFLGVRRRWLLGAAAALALLALGTRAWVHFYATPAPEELLAREVLSAHARSLQAGLPGHLTDIASSDKHKVKPWFPPKVNYAVWVWDLGEQEFPLVGGRLDYIQDRSVAALVYRRREHYINLFLWPAPGEPDASPRALRRRGARLYHWTKEGMTYWAVSDLNDAELRTFVELVQTSP
jgi:anti-sigma factor RsiW